MKAPIIELHISNPHQREAFRHVSFVTPVATATICGLGVDGYPIAVEADVVPDRPRQDVTAGADRAYPVRTGRVVISDTARTAA